MKCEGLGTCVQGHILKGFLVSSVKTTEKCNIIIRGELKLKLKTLNPLDPTIGLLSWLFQLFSEKHLENK